MTDNKITPFIIDSDDNAKRLALISETMSDPIQFLEVKKMLCVFAEMANDIRNPSCQQARDFFDTFDIFYNLCKAAKGGCQ